MFPRPESSACMRPLAASTSRPVSRSVLRGQDQRQLPRQRRPADDPGRGDPVRCGQRPAARHHGFDLDHRASHRRGERRGREIPGSAGMQHHAHLRMRRPGRVPARSVATRAQAAARLRLRPRGGQGARLRRAFRWRRRGEPGGNGALKRHRRDVHDRRAVFHRARNGAAGHFHCSSWGGQRAQAGDRSAAARRCQGRSRISPSRLRGSAICTMRSRPA